MNIADYKIAVSMLIETITFHIEGYEMGMYAEDKEEWADIIIEKLYQRIEIIRKFEWEDSDMVPKEDKYPYDPYYADKE